MARTQVAAAILLATLGAGCDDPGPPAPPRPRTSAPAPAVDPTVSPKPPTTQALLEGRWRTVPLSVLPFTLTVPDSWQPSTLGDTGLLALEGFSPHGPIQLRFSSRLAMDTERFEAFVNQARKEMDGKGPDKLRFEVKQFPEYTVIERMYTEPARTMLSTDSDGNLIEREGTPLKWSLLVFLKAETKLDAYELAFIELPRDQFERDKEFLQKVMTSLAFDPNKKPS